MGTEVARHAIDAGISESRAPALIAPGLPFAVPRLGGLQHGDAVGMPLVGAGLLIAAGVWSHFTERHWHNPSARKAGTNSRPRTRTHTHTRTHAHAHTHTTHIIDIATISRRTAAAPSATGTCICLGATHVRTNPTCINATARPFVADRRRQCAHTDTGLASFEEHRANTISGGIEDGDRDATAALTASAVASLCALRFGVRVDPARREPTVP
ncbi:hypothetical protein SBBP1_1210022 [Burkholderiales bacterium]|nr:hypothetical protein SBBP1_1210022 [Burkholderiales bacterium]